MIQSALTTTDRSAKSMMIWLLAVTTGFILVVGYAIARFQDTSRSSIRPTQQAEKWIRASGDPGHAGYFRKRFDLPGEVQHAWIKIAATDGFEINVNRNTLGKVYLWRPTRPFQTGTGERGQVLLPQDPAMALNFPREYQWDGHDSWRLPSYIELTSSLKQGKNVIAIETESRLAPSRVSFVGEIQLRSGETIPLNSDESWSAEPAPPGPQELDWTEVFYEDFQWRQAIIAEAPITTGYRSHPEEIYTRAFQGHWLRHPSASSKSAVSFSSTWRIDQPVDEAYIRLLTNRGYELHINDVKVRVASTKSPDLDNGEWVFGRGAAQDPTTSPELLDPDEVGSTFVGNRFESPRTADPNLGEFRQPFSPAVSPFRRDRTFDRSRAAGEIDPTRTLAESRRTPTTRAGFPERPIPNSLKHDHATGGYLAYSIANLLHVGDNRIQIRCLDSAGSNWPTQVAVDGGCVSKTGQQIQFVRDTDWMASEHTSEIEDPSPHPVERLSRAVASGKKIPRMQYRGSALHPQVFAQLLPATLWNVALLTLLGIAIVLVGAVVMDVQSGRFCGEIDTADKPLWYSTAQMIYAMLLTATVSVAAGLLLENAWTERHEILWFLDGTMWKVTFAVAATAAFAVGIANTVGRFGLTKLRGQGHEVSTLIRDLPRSRVWFHLIIWVLLIGGLLRAYKLDMQPLDDDEYASTQAVLSILETGAPGFVPDDVFYTRSPFYHYFTAAIAWPFGGDLWTLRLQTVAWSLATAWLAYLCGSRLLGSRWGGLFSMVMICLHPFEIFTGHVIRFYQMQQFFALLTMYCFCRGFVTDQSQRWRVATLIVFLIAVLSQEITVAMGPSLLIGYLVFAKDLGWRRNISLGLVSIAVVACIGLDFVVFQTLCLTRTEGVSPSIEASVKPHFWYSMNLLSMFTGYSRLHIVPSLFLFAGLPLLWREKNRNTLAMWSFLLTGVLMTNVLVTNVSFRYMYWLIPVWILMSVDAMRLVLATLVTVVYPREGHLNRYVITLGANCAICLACIFASWSLWRIPGSYELRILGDSTGAMRWVRANRQPDDLVAVTEPHTHCAFIENGKCDYDLAIPLLYDFAVMRDGKLVDRNGGGEVVSNVDQLIGEFSKGNRIWLLLNREKFRTRGKNMRWEYPGARFEKFIRQNCELKHRTYLWSVYLWDPQKGHYKPFRLQE